MSTWKQSWGGTLLVVAGASASLHSPVVAQAASPEPSSASVAESTARLRVPDPAIEWPLRQAINGAHRRLEDPACQEVFSDFQALDGTVLSDVLADRQLTPQEHLGRLAFWDGSHFRQCQRPGIAFITGPGYAIVYVCPSGFRRLSRDPGRAQATVIHEVLHTLGMGENPPTPREITNRVLERCGQ
jgi:hypothetical protein